MMKMKVNVKNITSEMQSIQQQFDKISLANLRKQTALMVNDLKAATPLDTGKARRNWSYKQVSPTKFSITNPVDYIAKLNRGSSRQAPAFFIESTAIKYGKPLGAIVDETPSIIVQIE